MASPKGLLVALCSFWVARATAATPRRLAPRAYDPLPAGAVTPKGWLLKQLTLQAEGLSGHLAQFWNDVMDSIWIGGRGDGGLHERTPYWLNGVVPLAFLLKNAGIEQLPPVVGIYKAPWGRGERSSPICTLGSDVEGADVAGADGYEVGSVQQCADDCEGHGSCHGFVVDNCTSQMRCWLKGSARPSKQGSCRCFGKRIPTPHPVDLMAQVEKYISHILAHQNSDGWLGPQMSEKDGGVYWGPSNALQALYQYAEGSNDSVKFKNATGAILAHLLEQKRRMGSARLASWAAARWVDMALTAEWLLDHADVGSHAEDLFELIGMLHDQGSNWDQWFEHFTGNAGDHNVNNAQGLKSAAVYQRYNASASFEGHSMAQLSQRRMANLDALYGLPTGMFNGDELLPSPASRSPSRGIELCGVVEAMFSYNVMFSVHGDVSFAERAEKIAYNALPATWASPRGGDMWAHQYLQAVNEISAIKADPHVWTHDGDMAETYGLEPNYGCCTANFHQGWPKFANMIFHTAPDGGVVVALWAPAAATLKSGAQVEIETEYPFEDQAVVSVTSQTAMNIHLRIPGWATGATVNGAAAPNGTMWRGAAGVGTSRFVVRFHPRIILQEWDGGAVSVHRGALMFSLPIQGNYTMYAHHFGTDAMSSDYYVEPTTSWQFALDIDPRAVDQSLTFASKGYVDGAAPFNHSNWPSTITANVRSLPSWGTQLNSAAVPPTSPACRSSATCGPLEQRSLVPHGGTDLRIGEFPLASFPGLVFSHPEEKVYV